MSTPTTISALEKDLKDAQERAERAALEAAAISSAHEEAVKAREEKLERERLRREKDSARLTKQLFEISHKDLIESLLDRGVTCLGKQYVTAYDLILESAEIFEQSYWATGAEIIADTWAPTEEELLATVDGLDKYLVVPSKDGFMSVTGVCSIGAIGLVRAMRAQSQNPLDEAAHLNFSGLYNSDWPTRVATDCTAAAMREEANFANGTITKASTDSIMTLNDSYFTKVQVIESFRKALSHPALEADELWGLRPKGYYLNQYPLFGSQQEAQDFADAYAMYINSGIYDDQVLGRAGRALYGHYGSIREFTPELLGSKERYEQQAAARGATPVSETWGFLQPNKVTSNMTDTPTSDNDDDDENDDE